MVLYLDAMVRVEFDDVHSLSYRRQLVRGGRATVIDGQDTVGRRFRIVLRHNGTTARNRGAQRVMKPRWPSSRRNGAAT